MKIVRHSDPDFQERCRALKASSSLFDPEIEARVRQIIEQVRLRGDEALLEFTERFDKARLTPGQLAVTKAELMAAFTKATPSLRQMITRAKRNIEKFARHSLRRNWSARNEQGGRTGEKFDPFQRVGIYVPGGTAPLVSTALMTIVLAKTAGCPEIVVCTPCGPDGAVNPALLFAAKTAGATEIYKLGGAQAIAAMALGSETIRRVQKLFGPGNTYVVTAKRLLFGHVAIDLPPGASELLVLADDSAEPRFIAADMLAQAEHGSGDERVWLVTPSWRLLRNVEKEIARQIKVLPRGKYIQRVLDQNGWLVQVANLEAGIQLTNRLAPEHCEILTRGEGKIARQILTAGALLLGPWSPAVLGDYCAGPSHVLPTGGAGVSFSGLTVDQFQRRTSVVEYSRRSLQESLSMVKTFAEMEGLEAHGRSASIRFEPAPGKIVRERKGSA